MVGVGGSGVKASQCVSDEMPPREVQPRHDMDITREKGPGELFSCPFLLSFPCPMFFSFQNNVSRHKMPAELGGIMDIVAIGVTCYLPPAGKKANKKNCTCDAAKWNAKARQKEAEGTRHREKALREGEEYGIVAVCHAAGRCTMSGPCWVRGTGENPSTPTTSKPLPVLLRFFLPLNCLILKPMSCLPINKKKM